MRVVTNERLRYPQNPWVWTFLTKEGETRKVIWRLYYKGVHCEKTSDDRNQHTVTYTRRGAEDLIETGTVKRRYSVENDVVTCVELDPVNDTVIETVHHDVDFYIGDIGKYVHLEWGYVNVVHFLSIFLCLICFVGLFCR